MLQGLQNSWHYITGLAIIGAVSGLMATGNVDATAGLPIIAGVGSVLIGGTLGAQVPK